ncbi:hypothetical protein AB0G02_27180 [Actinosynnema sp. NPDC023658]|uniref:carboxypeptidase-like regulatory domain-containing protein n=1 Tax=Actinosynnema sp. NPDC023658 TaxID=3155465 RepID=UPI0033E1EDC1
MGALLLTAAVCAATSAGPAFAEPTTSAGLATATAADPATEPAVTDPTAAEPTTEPVVTEPITAQPTTAPVVTEPAAAEPGTTEPPTTPATGPVAAEPAPAPGTVDLAITVAFDRPEFFVDENVTARARVMNRGTATARGVQLVSSAPNLENTDDWEGFPTTREVDVEPGHALEGTLSSPVKATDNPFTLTLVVTVRSSGPDADEADNTVTVTAMVKVQLGGYTGIVYGDRNGNTVVDAGESLAGFEVAATVEGRPGGSYSTTTDSTGRFTFRDLPRGDYRTWFARGEWYFRPPLVHVDGVDDPDVVIRGALPVPDVLTAEARFDRATYRAGDVARLSLILTNGGSIPVPEVTAVCQASTATPLDLGDLAAAGVTVAAHSTSTTSVAIPIDASVVDGGALVVRCTFGAPPEVNGSVSAYAIARVPGARAAVVVGRVVSSVRPPNMTPRPGGAPVPNVKIYLKDQVTGAVVVRATSDAGGDFEFLDVPAGVYDVGLVGRYILVDPFTMHIRASESGTSHVVMVWAGGPDQPDPGPAPQPGDPTPEPGAPVPPATGPGQQSPPLASTGVNVTWLALGGLLTVLAGIGMVVRPVRRRV